MSFDVVSLFTEISLDEAIIIINEVVDPSIDKLVIQHVFDQALLVFKGNFINILVE